MAALKKKIENIAAEEAERRNAVSRRSWRLEKYGYLPVVKPSAASAAIIGGWRQI